MSPSPVEVLLRGLGFDVELTSAYAGSTDTRALLYPVSGQGWWPGLEGARRGNT